MASDAWICTRCCTRNDADSLLCSDCGARPDGSVNPAMAALQPGGRMLDCLRCSKPMTYQGLRRFHEGSQAAPFLFGGLGELLVHREGFDVFACSTCGKVELFLPHGDG